MKLARIAKHLFAPRGLVARRFPEKTLAAITTAVGASEKLHDGELRIAIEAGLKPLPLWREQSPRQRAVELFAQFKIRDTKHGSGVLIYLQLVDRCIEVVADSGISSKVAQHEWDAVCRRMESAFKLGAFETGTIKAIEEISALLAAHFPPLGDNPNELPDGPAVFPAP